MKSNLTISITVITVTRFYKAAEGQMQYFWQSFVLIFGAHHQLFISISLFVCVTKFILKDQILFYTLIFLSI